MYSVQRWIKLLVLLLALVSVNVLAEEGEHINDEGGVVEDIQEAAEAAVDYIEHVAEVVAEKAHVQDVQHAVEEVVENIVEASEGLKASTAKATKSLVDNIKTKVSSAVDRIVTESKNVIERCKKGCCRCGWHLGCRGGCWLPNEGNNTSTTTVINGKNVC